MTSLNENVYFSPGWLCIPEHDAFHCQTSLWTACEQWAKLVLFLRVYSNDAKGITLIVLKIFISYPDPTYFFLFSQVKWAESTWCSTRFLLDIVATLRGQLVLLDPPETRDPAESLGRQVELVSLEAQVHLEIKESEVLYFSTFSKKYT